MTTDMSVINSPPVDVRTLVLLSEETKISEEPQRKGAHDISVALEHTQYVLL